MKKVIFLAVCVVLSCKALRKVPESSLQSAERASRHWSDPSVSFVEGVFKEKPALIGGSITASLIKRIENESLPLQYERLVAEIASIPGVKIIARPESEAAVPSSYAVPRMVASVEGPNGNEFFGVDAESLYGEAQLEAIVWNNVDQEFHSTITGNFRGSIQSFSAPAGCGGCHGGGMPFVLEKNLRGGDQDSIDRILARTRSSVIKSIVSSRNYPKYRLGYYGDVGSAALKYVMYRQTHSRDMGTRSMPFSPVALSGRGGNGSPVNGETSYWDLIGDPNSILFDPSKVQGRPEMFYGMVPFDLTVIENLAAKFKQFNIEYDPSLLSLGYGNETTTRGFLVARGEEFRRQEVKRQHLSSRREFYGRLVTSPAFQKLRDVLGGEVKVNAVAIDEDLLEVIDIDPASFVVQGLDQNPYFVNASLGAAMFPNGEVDHTLHEVTLKFDTQCAGCHAFVHVDRLSELQKVSKVIRFSAEVDTEFVVKKLLNPKGWVDDKYSFDPKTFVMPGGGYSHDPMEHTLKTRYEEKGVFWHRKLIDIYRNHEDIAKRM